ncbi:hypothetical protein SLEP1_g15653 [Rubroshorea leprosula]|uniref:Secreted protein n=1 Tax=Rubroshorea leprosula TaxID=152421 RepID=A0AAV5IN40_9ROSI|nr:hypothetical protein SLEP1_g15653 [Rubroshorea leprosula]
MLCLSFSLFSLSNQKRNEAVTILVVLKSVKIEHGRASVPRRGDPDGLWEEVATRRQPVCRSRDGVSPCL